MLDSDNFYEEKKRRGNGEEEVEEGENDMDFPLPKHLFPSLLPLRVAPIQPLR